MSSEEDANKELVGSWVNDVLRRPAKDPGEWLTWVRRRAHEYWDENYIAHHDPTARGREGLVDRLAALSSAFSNPQVELLLLFAKGDMVSDCLRITADHTGSLLGIPPSGKKVTWLQNEMFRLKGGRIVEGWVTRDWLGLLQQLGALKAAR